MTSGREPDWALRPANGAARLRVGVIGCGYWGPHLIRNLHEMTEAELLAVSDRKRDRLAHVSARYPGVELFADHRELLATGVQAVVIATPIHTHYALARDALLADRHVLVEKPLAASVPEAAELVRLARRRGLVLMAGHTFIYNPAVRELRRLVQHGELGRIYYGDAARLNLGLFQRHGFKDQSVNSRVVAFWLSHARELGITAVLAHSANGSVYSLRSGSLTATGRVIEAAS